MEFPKKSCFNDSTFCYFHLKCATKRIGKIHSINLIPFPFMPSIERKAFPFHSNHCSRLSQTKHLLPPRKKIPKKTVVIASKSGALYAKSLWHSQSWEEQQQGCASAEMKPISGFNFQKEMPCLFHVSLCFRSEQRQKKRTKLKPLVGLAISKQSRGQMESLSIGWSPCLVCPWSLWKQLSKPHSCWMRTNTYAHFQMFI